MLKNEQSGLFNGRRDILGGESQRVGNNKERTSFSEGGVEPRANA